VITAPCPRCGERNAADAIQCTRCATPLHGGSAAAAAGGASTGGVAGDSAGGAAGAAAGAGGRSVWSASGDAVANYPQLRRLAGVCGLAGFTAGVCGSLAAVAIFLRLGPPALLPRLGLSAAALLIGGVLYLVLKVTAERIVIVLDIEKNTRRSARLLEDLLRRDQEE
jgi:hypothetical protein